MSDEVVERLARIETALTSRADHETRLRSGERRQWIFAGAVLALQPVLSKLGIHLPV
jgi:hypothetical protein